MNKIKPLLTSETSDKQLYELADKLHLHINNICYVDQLRYIPAKDGNYIINLRYPEHWTGLRIDRKKGFYFNSYSSIMQTPKEVIQFLKRAGCNKYYDSNKSVQLTREGHCGQFTVDFLVYMNKTGDPVTSYERFLNHLHSTNKENIQYAIRHI